MKVRLNRVPHLSEKLILLSVLICLLVFLATVPLPRVDDKLIGSDGVRYYAILRSVTLDGDFRFANDYQLLGRNPQTTTVTGLTPNPFAIGAAVLWAPFFLAAHLVSLVARGIGLPVSANGISYIYQAMVCIGTILYAGAGFLLSFRVTQRFTSRRIAALSVLVFWWASQAIYYVVAEPSMSHGLTIFTQALFLYVWYPPDPNRSSTDWALLAGSVGIAALVRWQEGIVAAIPVAELLYWTYRRKLTYTETIRHLLVYGFIILIVFSPQMLMWNAVYGSPITMPQSSAFMDWFSPEPLQTLLSTRHGLITWHPIFLLALLGLFPLWKRDRALTVIVLALFLGQLYINSSVVRWWADDAFGGRRFTGIIPLLIVPLACLIEDVSVDRIFKFIGLLLIVLVVWNGLSFAQYRLGFVSKSEALTMQEMTVDRLVLPFKLLRLLIS